MNNPFVNSTAVEIGTDEISNTPLTKNEKLKRALIIGGVVVGATAVSVIIKRAYNNRGISIEA